MAGRSLSLEACPSMRILTQDWAFLQRWLWSARWHFFVSRVALPLLCVLDESERLAAGDKLRHPEEVFIFFVVYARD